MLQRQITFEWNIGEDTFEFWRGRTGVESAPATLLTSREKQLVLWLVRSFGLLVIVGLVASGASFSPAQIARVQTQLVIQDVLDREDISRQTGDRHLFESLIAPNVDEYWVYEWRGYWRSSSQEQHSPDAFRLDLLNVELIRGERLEQGEDKAQQDITLADVRITQPNTEWWHTSPYRETRFYQQFGQSWLRVVPPSAYWGERNVLELESVRFIYYEPDADAVAEAAPVIEEVYLNLYELLGIPHPGRMTIAVLPNQTTRWPPSDNMLEVTAPALAKIPASFTDADYLADDVLNDLTYRVIRDASPGPASRYLYRWPVMVWGLRNWLRAELIDKPSPWQVEGRAIFREYSQGHLPLGLSVITDLHTGARPSREHVIWRLMAAESLVDYVVDTYGRERLPGLIDGMIEYGTWEILVKEVYSVSYEEFLAEWNLYLLEEYELEK